MKTTFHLVAAGLLVLCGLFSPGNSALATDRPPVGFTVLHTMSPPQSNTPYPPYPTNLDGAHIDGTLTRGMDGAYYGVAHDVGPHLSGTIFKITADGVFTRLYAFSREDEVGNNPDGELPINGLTQAADGSFYGTTAYGGTVGQGVVFRFTTDGTEAGSHLIPLVYLNTGSGTVNNTIYRLYAPFTLASDNCFYAPCFIIGQNVGGICKLRTDGTANGSTLSILVTFDYNASQLGRPEGRVIEGPDHFLYGLARTGGPDPYLGGVYRLGKDGSQPQILYAFGQNYPHDGENPVGGLTLGPDGTFYGVTGAITENTSDYPVAFRMTTDGTAGGTTLTPIHEFLVGQGVPSDLTIGADGRLYGTTANGGDYYHGSIFSMETDGSDFQQLYSLADRAGNAPGVDGSEPGNLIFDPTTGSFFGSTKIEGANDYGTIFRYTPPLGALPPIGAFSATGPSSVGQPITFTATTGAGLAVRVQGTSTPSDEGSWTDLPGGGAMTENAAANPGAGNYSLVASAYPFGSAVYFRAIAAKPSFTDGKSAPLGPYNLVPSATISATGPAGDGQPIHFQVDTASGFRVQIQVSKDSSDPTAWKNLASPNSGVAAEVSGTPGTYTLDSSSYPNGSGIAFRAVASKAGYDDILTAPLTGFTLHNAELTISCLFSSPSAANGSIVHPGEPLTVTFVVTNIGSVQAKNPHVEAIFAPYPQARTLTLKQFLSKDVTFTSGGRYVAATSSSALDAKAQWDLGNIDAGLSTTVSYTVVIPADLDYPRTYGVVGSTYSVRSTANPPVPADVVTGETTSQLPRETIVKAPISLTLTPASLTVAPGGLLTYNFTLTNLGPLSIAHAVAAVEVPDHVRYAESYLPRTGAATTAVKYVSKRGAPPHKRVFYQNGTHSQVVVNLGLLYPKGDRAHRDSVTFSVTFQAQWIDPSQVTLQQLSSIHYGAAFLTPANPRTRTNPYLTFVQLLTASPAVPTDGPFTDFLTKFGEAGFSSALTQDDSGIVNVPFSGSVVGAPLLTAWKMLSNNAVDTQLEDDGSVDVVLPGARATFLLGLENGGGAVADDVYIENTIPEHTSYVLNSAVVTNRNLSTGRSRLVTVRDPDGHHLRFTGLHLEPGQNILLQYTVQVASGVSAPPAGTLLDIGPASIGSSSIPTTWEALVAAQSLKVGGQVLFAQPLVRTLIARPGVSADLSTTANALTAIYNSKPSALPLANPSDPLSYIPGVQRYYIHYKNIGPVAARGALLDFPLPAHTAFYRASFVTLAANARAHGDLGLLPGKLVPGPAGTKVLPPAGANNGFLATSGHVSFNLGTLAPTVEGDVMIELIVTNDAVLETGALLGGETEVTISDATVASLLSSELLTGLHEARAPVYNGSHQQRATLTTIPLADPQHVPTIGLTTRVSSDTVATNDTFQVTIIEANIGEFAAHSIVALTIPEGTVFVSGSAGQNTVIAPAPGEEGPGHQVYLNTTTNNGPLNGPSLLNPHTCGSLTVTLRVTAPAGSEIVLDQIRASTQYAGDLYASPIKIRAGSLLSGAAAAHGVFTPAGVPVLALNNGVALIDLGGNNIVAQGGGNVISNDGGTLIGQDGNGFIVTGAANSFHISNVTGLKNPTAADILAHRSELLSDAGGNVLVPPGTTIVAQGGLNILAPGVTSLLGTSANTILPPGGGNVISNDGGTVISDSGIGIISDNSGGLIGNAGGALHAQGGGAYIAAGGGTVISHDGGTLVNTNGSNLVNTNGSNIVTSPAGTTATLQNRDGTTFIVGGATAYRPTP